MPEKIERIAELGNRTWEELELLEHEDGSLLFKDYLRRRGTDGKIVAVPVRVKIVRGLPLAKARQETREWCEQIKIDAEKDRDVFDNLEQVAILSHAIREPKDPFPQFATKEELIQKYDEASLLDIKERIEVYRQLLDPRESTMSGEQLWSKIFRVKEAGHLLPLTDIAGHELTSCIVFMACQALQSPTGAAYVRSLGNSTPEPSHEKSSTQSSEVEQAK